MSEVSLPRSASAVVIGGGVIGAQRANESHARLTQYSMALLEELERETGQSTGFRQVGSLSIAHSTARWEELRRVASMNNAFDEILRVGAGHGLKPAGMHALDSCRIEKKFVHYGHDIGDEDTPLEAGLGFVCALEKSIPFIGREAILRQKEKPLAKRLVQFLLQDPEVMLYHHEPIRRDGQIVGHLTSGAYGHTLGGSVGLGYVRCAGGVSKDWIESGDWTVEVGGERVPVRASLRALYDPRGERMRE